eukprot:gb/GFBE01037566.1/.p1 GENE.gb/GFBE01037566.1/~~gb/GFBE01037566.1/.p1  ORF type:complete len:174 (+),score=38.95 gb/GFBE01037566.1/:1-522(+)
MIAVGVTPCFAMKQAWQNIKPNPRNAWNCFKGMTRKSGSTPVQACCITSETLPRKTIEAVKVDDVCGQELTKTHEVSCVSTETRNTWEKSLASEARTSCGSDEDEEEELYFLDTGSAWSPCNSETCSVASFGEDSEEEHKEEAPFNLPCQPLTQSLCDKIQSRGDLSGGSNSQ